MSRIMLFLKSIPFWFLFIWSFALALLTSAIALIFVNTQWLQTAALIIWVAFFFLPILPLIDSFEEIGLPGITLKTRNKIVAIQQKLIQNRVVRVIDIDKTYLFWVDDSKTPHRLPDDDKEETARFLAGQDGILEIDSDELKQLKPIAKDTLPKVESAALPKHHGATVFILYNGVLYYQSSLGFLYRLAALTGYPFMNKNKSIADGGWDDWVKPLKERDLMDNLVK